MCLNYAAGKPCTFGKNCNYAHGERELKKFLAKQAEAEGKKIEPIPSSDAADSDKIEAKKPIERDDV